MNKNRKENLFCKNNTQITVWQRKSVSDMWSLLIDIYYYEKNYATKQSNQSQIHTQSWKIAQKVSKNAILKNIASMAKNKWRILKKQSAAFWRKKQMKKKQTKHKL